MSEIVYHSITLLKSLVVGALAFQILQDLALALAPLHMCHPWHSTYKASLTGFKPTASLIRIVQLPPSEKHLVHSFNFC